MLEQLAPGEKVCRIKKALYDLKQASQAWYPRPEQELRALEQRRRKRTPMFTYDRAEDIQWSSSFVNYILVILCQDPGIITDFGNQLPYSFEVKDIEELKRCLGIDFKLSEDGIAVDQKTYVLDILQQFRRQNYNPLVNATEGKDVANQRRPTSRCRWEETALPSFIVVPTVLLSRHASKHCPCNKHIKSVRWLFKDSLGTVKRILRYLKFISDKSLIHHRGRMLSKAVKEAIRMYVRLVLIFYRSIFLW